MGRFEKGKSGNPGGRTKMPAEVKEARMLNRKTMELALNKFLTWKVSDLVDFVNDRSNPTMEVIVAKILSEAIKRGDQIRLNFIFDRLIGKVKEEVQLHGAKPTIIQLLNNEGQIVLGTEKTLKDIEGIE